MPVPMTASDFRKKRRQQTLNILAPGAQTRSGQRQLERQESRRDETDQRLSLIREGNRAADAALEQSGFAPGSQALLREGGRVRREALNQLESGVTSADVDSQRVAERLAPEFDQFTQDRQRGIISESGRRRAAEQNIIREQDLARAEREQQMRQSEQRLEQELLLGSEEVRGLRLRNDLTQELNPIAIDEAQLANDVAKKQAVVQMANSELQAEVLEQIPASILAEARTAEELAGIAEDYLRSDVATDTADLLQRTKAARLGAEKAKVAASGRVASTQVDLAKAQVARARAEASKVQQESTRAVLSNEALISRLDDPETKDKMEAALLGLPDKEALLLAANSEALGVAIGTILENDPTIDVDDLRDKLALVATVLKDTQQ